MRLLNVGNDILLNDEAIVGVFDLDKTTTFKTNRNYLSNMEKKGKIISVTEKLPKSFIVCFDGEEEKVYISQLMPSTLLKRNL